MPHPQKAKKQENNPSDDFLDVQELMTLGGKIGLSPKEIYEMTPCEYNGLLKGHLEEVHRQAYYVHLLTAVHLGKKAPSTSAIAGFSFVKEDAGEAIAEGVHKTFDSTEDKVREINEMKRLFGL